MLSVHNGYSVKYLTDQVAKGREAYYTDAVTAGEPAGLWFGRGARLLGLRGEVDAEVMEAVYAHFLDPRHEATQDRATWGQAPRFARGHYHYRSTEQVYEAKLAAEPGAGPERRAQLRVEAAKSTKQPLQFIDLTFSAPKSFSVLAVAFEHEAAAARARGDDEATAIYAGYHQAVEDAVMAGSQAAIEYLQDVAGYGRIGHHGGKAGRWIDAHNWVVASFLQHDSREHDPQLHVHNAVLDRAQCADGVWRALDTQAIKAHRPAAAAVAERTAEAYLTQSVPLQLVAHENGAAREIAGVAQSLLHAYSNRAQQINPLADRQITEWEQRTGTQITPLQRHRMRQWATLATRAPKTHRGETNDERLARWADMARAEQDGGLRTVVEDVLGLVPGPAGAERWSAHDVKARAVAMVESEHQAWRRADLLQAVANSLPPNLGLAPEKVRPLLEALTDEALADPELVTQITRPESVAHLDDQYKLASGTSSYQRPGTQWYAGTRTIAAERALRAAAVERGAMRFTDKHTKTALDRLTALGLELGADQAAVVRGVMTSGARLEILSAPAGTGKSYTVGALNAVWREDGRRVFGLAAWQRAAEVLAEEGLDARNVARWLATQRRLADATSEEDPHGDENWRMRPGDLVVVDEAGTIPTLDLAEVQRRCDLAGAKLLLVGDPHQLAPVGPGGALADLAERGVRYQLSDVRRFANHWEGPSSLRVRDGDVTALGEYAKHGRILDGGTTEQAEAKVARMWLADTLAGQESLVVVATNESAARISGALRAELVVLGKVTETGVELRRDGNVAGAGDLVQARKNEWTLLGYEGNAEAPVNRKTYRALSTREDGGLVVARVLGRQDDDEQLGESLTLPAEYVAEHLTLGYASTVHAAIGRTVDTSYPIPDKHTDAGSFYVMSTRGRLRNTLVVPTLDLAEDATTQDRADAAAVVTDGVALEEDSRERRDPLGILATALERNRPNADEQASALTLQARADEDARSVEHLDRLAEVAATLTRERTSTHLDQLAADGVLPAEQRTKLGADANYEWVEHALRRAEIAGHHPAEVLRGALTLGGSTLEKCRSLGSVLSDRIDRWVRKHPGRPTLTSYSDLIPADLSEDTRAMLARYADDADDRRRELGARAAREAPQWALDALGPVPPDVLGREDWEHRAGWIAAYREWTGTAAEPATTVGPAPGVAQPERRAAWSTAAAALVNEPAPTDEQQLSEGQLRVRVHAMARELDWAPRWVDDELAAVSRAADEARATALLAAARAEATEDAAQRDQLFAETQAAAQQEREFSEQRAALETADTTRSAWYEHTLATRQAAERARHELLARGIPVDAPQDLVTAEEWLAAHRADQLVEDQVRPVTETELREAEDQDSDQPEVVDVLETEVPDLRDLSVRDELEDSDAARRERIPTVDEQTDILARHHAAYLEMRQRREAEAAQERHWADEQADAAREHDELLQREEDRAAARVSETAPDADHDQAEDVAAAP